VVLVALVVEVVVNMKAVAGEVTMVAQWCQLTHIARVILHMDLGLTTMAAISPIRVATILGMDML
jgi:hypothetical protein